MNQNHCLLLIFFRSLRNFATLCRGLGVFHGLLGFGGALLAGFRALLALFFLELFAAEELDENGVGAIAFAPAQLHDAQVAALAVAEPGPMTSNSLSTAALVMR